ncbi:MAG: beta-lactamase family protein [Bacteroidales bacterium]|nr:beta-lactamase family protein [Bacteroidales bacterium]
MLRKVVYTIIIFCLFATCSKNDDSNELPKFSNQTVQSLDSIINSEIQNQNLPGVVVGVWVPGVGEYVKTFGKANLETEVPRELTDQLRIASITKTFTGLRILQLHDDGKFNIDDTLVKYFPDFPKANAIKIRHLLNMNSGIKDFADHEFLHIWYDDLLMPFSMEEAMELSVQDSADFYNAGDSVIYCNVNYTILGLIIENITGNMISEEIHEHIFKPLGMNSSIYPNDKILPGKLKGYSWNESENKFEDKTELNPDVPNAAGAIISNIYDLKRYVKALYTGELIKQETHEEQINTIQMQGSPEWVQYGLGIINLCGFYGHNGTIFGFSTEMFYLPEKDAVIIINVNRLDVDDNSKSGPLFFKIAKYLFPEHVKW